MDEAERDENPAETQETAQLVVHASPRMEAEPTRSVLPSVGKSGRSTWMRGSRTWSIIVRMDGFASIGIILGLTLLNGFFTGAELALITVRKSRLEERAEEGSESAKAALALRSDPEGFLATCQIGITLVGASTGAFAGAELAEPITRWLDSVGLGPWAHRAALATVVTGISYLSIVLGELVPKSLALRSSESLALFVARPMRGLASVARPFVWLLRSSSNLVLRPFRDTTTFVEGRLSPDELRQLVEEASEAGTLDLEAGEIAARAIDFSSIPLRAVMVPRPRVASLSFDATSEAVRTLLRSRPHSRYPVFGAGIDEVMGYVVARDLYERMLDGPLDLRALVRPCTFLPEAMLAVDALRALQQARSGIGVVVDEGGAVAGLVAVEDLAEELVGDIFAEHEAPVRLVEHEGPGVHLIDGAAPLHDVNRELGLDLARPHGIATLAGAVLHAAGEIPRTGDVVTLEDGVVAEIVEATPQRIRRIRLRVPMRPSDPGDSD